ncbi:hypothetical protein ACWIGI_41575 [Nocardia sp. NPDC055321]
MIIEGNESSGRVWDRVVGWGLYVAAVALGLTAAVFNMAIAALAAGIHCQYDDCDSGGTPTHFLGGAIVAWAGILVALVGALTLMIRSQRQGRMIWFWPLPAIAIIVASFCAGFYASGS